METIAVRQPPSGERGTEETEPERRRTHYLLPCSPWRLFSAHFSLLFRAPGRYLGGFRLALTVRSPGLRALVYQMFYFAEAGLVAARMKQRSLFHIHNHSPDAGGYVTMLAAHLGDFTYSMTLHGFGIFSEPRRWRLADKLERCLFAICVSWHGRSQAMLWSDSRHWPRFHLVHCGINPEEFEPRHHSGRGSRLLFVGRFDHVKGLPLLLEAIEILVRTHPSVHLDLAGDGPQRAALEQLVQEKELSDHVTFHGYLSQPALRKLHSKADVCVMTSFAEGIPVGLMEAMAAGVPVVAPRITGIPELVNDGVNGYLTIPGNVESLVGRIERLLKDPELRNTFAVRGRDTVENEFSLRREVSLLVEIMKARLEGREIAVRTGTTNGDALISREEYIPAVESESSVGEVTS